MARFLSTRRRRTPRLRLTKALLDQHRVARIAARATAIRVAFAFTLTYFLLRDLNARSLQTGYRPYTSAAIQALALSFVAKPVGDSATAAEFRTLQSFNDTWKLVVYWSLEDEASALALRDMGWLHTAFETRGLRILAVSVDEPDRYSDLVEEASFRNFGFPVLQDSPGHARLMRRASGLPIVLLVSSDGSVREATTGIADRLRRSFWGTPPAYKLLQELLPVSNRKSRSS